MPPSISLRALPLVAGFGSFIASLQAQDLIPNWIWSSPNGKDGEVVYFRKTFEAKPGEKATISATCDNEMIVYVNGKKVAESIEWQAQKFADITSLLVDGKNLVAVQAKNQGNGAAGFIAKIQIKHPDKKEQIVTDASWKISGLEGRDWKTLTLNDASWTPAVVVAPAGGGAWAATIKPKSLDAEYAMKAPEATQVSAIKVKEGFKVELLYSVPIAEQGSWVATCFDDKGRMIASDQYGKLYRLTPPAIGGKAEATKVEPIPVDLGEAQGLTYSFGALYAVTNSDKYPRGLYRITDTNKDDQFDKVEALRLFPNQGGEHGSHAVVPGPDGKSLYIISGNQTPLPKMETSRVPQHWAEDNLLPPMVGHGFMAAVKAPGGWVAKTDPDGKSWELVATGFRNEYDGAFNRDGALFTFDADMEWDISLPFYRPTRVCEVVSGAEFGWRAISKKWPVRWEDSVPPVVNIGPGSPTGVCFGYGANFPQKYQDAFYISDWSYGKLYAVHLKPQGAGYAADFEEFISASPLPLTDVVVNPKDGAMYFTIGGRRVQAGVYRVTSTTGKVAGPIAAKPPLLDLRRRIEALHVKPDVRTVPFVWPYLSHEDRLIRFAARIALEQQPVAEWKSKALQEKNPRASLTSLMALARSAGDDKSLLGPLLDALDAIDFKKLTADDQDTYIRDYQLAFSRLGMPDANYLAKTTAKLSALFPTKEPMNDVDLGEILAYLGDTNFLPKAIAILETAPSQEEQISHAKNLRFVKNGWTSDLRDRYFKWICLRAPTYKGGAGFQAFMKDIKKDALAQCDDAEKARLKPILDTVPDVKTPQFNFTAREFVKDWKIEDIDPLLAVGLEGGRKFENGRNLFGATACFACHHFGDEGGVIGPDLTSVAGKYSPRDLLINIIEPSKEISDQYGQIEFTMLDDSKAFGRIMNLSGDSISVNVNMMDPNDNKSLDRKKIKSMAQSKVSMMPPGLLNTLSDKDILDLLAYLLSKGDKNNPLFK